jgi:hypothetical protein
MGEELCMRGFSLRTMILTMTGLSVFCGLFTMRGLPEVVIHTLLVLAFAVPGGSYGYDIGRSSRSIVVGTSVGAVAGTVLVSAAVLIMDLWRL